MEKGEGLGRGEVWEDKLRVLVAVMVGDVEEN